MNLARMRVSTFVVGLGAVLTACLPPLVVPIAREDGGSDANPPSDAAMPSPDVMASPDVVVPPDVSTAPDVMRPPPDVSTAPDATPPPDVVTMPGSGRVDLLLVVDDSNSMLRSQEAFVSAVGTTVSSMLRAGVSDVRVGVISTDLGTPGYTIPSCSAGPRGDDALLNPRAFGTASQQRSLPPVTASAFCTDMIARSTFVTVTSADDAMTVLWRPTCHVNLGIGGCGLEQPLEAIRRALITQSTEGGPNAGFLRPDATLAILLLTDEDDGSVRECSQHDGVGTCTDATDVYDIASTRWSSTDLNLRFYTYTPGSAQDPTWPIERYVDPARPTRGLLSLKPGHPERIVFGAITGTPTALPRTAAGNTDWDALLGPAAMGRPDDFNARDATRAFTDPMALGGAVSMRQSDIDPMCSNRVLPACRFVTPTNEPSCAIDTQPFAWRARRVAEVARRFDESLLCGAVPCRNGMVASICAPGDTAPFTQFAAMVARRAR